MSDGAATHADYVPIVAHASGCHGLVAAETFRPALSTNGRLHRSWSVPLPGYEVNGPPTIVGNKVFFSVVAATAIWAVDARTGRVVRKGSIGEPAFVTPVFLDGRIYAAGFLGCVRAFGWREPAGRLPARAREPPARPRDRRRALDHLPPLGVAAGRARS